MKKYLLAALFIGVSLYTPGLALGSQPQGDPPIAPPETPIIKTAAMKTAGGQDAGTITFTQTKEGVLLAIDMKNLTPGEHAFHIHEHGACKPPDSFAEAGAHLNPDGHPHGFMAANGPHDGDMTNLFISPDGTVDAHVFNVRVTMDKNDTSKRAQLLDADGSAIVLHTGPDDYATQPSGNAGAPLACGEISAP